MLVSGDVSQIVDQEEAFLQALCQYYEEVFERIFDRIVSQRNQASALAGITLAAVGILAAVGSWANIPIQVVGVALSGGAISFAAATMAFWPKQFQELAFSDEELQTHVDSHLVTFLQNKLYWLQRGCKTNARLHQLDERWLLFALFAFATTIVLALVALLITTTGGTV